MCWSVEKDKNPEIYHKTAQEDIIVYKFGNVCNDNCFHPYFYENLGYKKDTLNNEIKLEIIDGIVVDRFFKNPSENFLIKEGYHSYSGECFYDCRLHILDESYLFASHIGIFIIPKGSEYYENEDGEIVSSNIFWNGEYCKSIQVKKDMIKLKDYVLDCK